VKLAANVRRTWKGKRERQTTNTGKGREKDAILN